MNYNAARSNINHTILMRISQAEEEKVYIIYSNIFDYMFKNIQKYNRGN